MNLLQAMENENRRLRSDVEKLLKQNDQLIYQNTLALQKLQELGITITNQAKQHYILYKRKDVHNEYMFVSNQDKFQNKKHKYTPELEITVYQIPVDLVNSLKERIKFINNNAYGNVLENVKLSNEYKTACDSKKISMLNKAKKEHSQIIYKANKIFLKNYEKENFIRLVRCLDTDVV